MVSNATLHNEDYIAEKDIRIGDTVVIQRAGDVIPQVVRVVENKRPKRPKPYKFPDNCPVCGSHAVREKDENRERQRGCGPPLHRRAHLPGAGRGAPTSISSRRDAFDIEGLGGKRIEECFTRRACFKEPADIFSWRRIRDGHRVQRDGWGEQSARISSMPLSRTDVPLTASFMPWDS